MTNSDPTPSVFRFEPYQADHLCLRAPDRRFGAPLSVPSGYRSSGLQCCRCESLQREPLKPDGARGRKEREEQEEGTNQGQGSPDEAVSVPVQNAADKKCTCPAPTR